MRRPTALVISIMLAAALGAPPASAAEPAHARGEFAVTIDFTTLTMAPVGDACALTVEGEVSFSGSLAGRASGVTTALVLAPCEAVATHPPGTFADVFRADLHFTGGLDGTAVETNITYLGRTAVGGAISAGMVLSGDLAGRLAVEATLGVGGTYAGTVVSG